MFFNIAEKREFLLLVVLAFVSVIRLKMPVLLYRKDRHEQESIFENVLGFRLFAVGYGAVAHGQRCRVWQDYPFYHTLSTHQIAVLAFMAWGMIRHSPGHVLLFSAFYQSLGLLKIVLRINN